MSTRRRSRLRSRVLLGVGVLVLVVLVLGGLAGWHALQVKRSADAAQAGLESALDNLDKSRMQQARADVDESRAAVDDARDHADSWPLDVVESLPWIGSAVDDTRSLTDAIDHATGVAESGLELYPLVKGRNSTLVRGEQVDMPTLQKVVDGAHEVGDKLDAALASLDEVQGDAPFVGSAIADARDRARKKLEPAAEGYATAEPVLDVLPSVLGAEGRKRYLLAMLNPAELRYSGGATLNWSPMSIDNGTIEIGRSYSNSDFAQDPFHVWKKVAGNPFRGKGEQRLVNATFSPIWSQSGEELLRAWRQQVGGRYDGVIAIDLQGLAKLMKLTGPVEVAGYGTLSGDNLVHELTGSYDEFEDQEERHRLNAALIPVFKAQLFGTSKIQGKMESLQSSGRERHFATYFRDPEVQEAFAALDMTGDLDFGDQDYVGVFAQNLNGSKVDIFQKRAVTHDVVLDEDGTAEVSMTIRVTNDAPAYAGVGEDPKYGYFTRWSVTKLAVLMPREATLGTISVNGNAMERRVRTADDFGFVTARIYLSPGSTGNVSLTYRVPGAAVQDEDGLHYRLNLDPQGIQNPQFHSLTVTWPEGWSVESPPEGWETVGSGKTRWQRPLTESTSLEISATR